MNQRRNTQAMASNSSFLGIFFLKIVYWFIDSVTQLLFNLSLKKNCIDTGYRYYPYSHNNTLISFNCITRMLKHIIYIKIKIIKNMIIIIFFYDYLSKVFGSHKMLINIFVRKKIRFTIVQKYMNTVKSENSIIS